MEISELQTEITEWDAFVRRSDEGTPFHLTAWRRAVDQAFGFRSHYLIARGRDGIEGVLPLFEVRGLLGGKALISVPYGVYGGICATSDTARRALVEAASELGRKCGAAYVELRQQRDQGVGLPIKKLYVMFERSISKSDEENALAIPGKQRRRTRQGAKHGLRATIGRDHLDHVYDIFAQNMRNLGTPVLPRRMFSAIFEAYGKDCQVVTIWHDGRVVSGVLTLFHHDRVLPYYGASLREAYAFAVNDFMYWELMRYSARAGYRIFDFSRSREGSGSYEFKRHWGFQPIPLPYQYILLRGQDLPNLSPSNPRFRLATEIWKRLPLIVTNRIGPFIARYLP
jgi:FemAB-related protein (PEP-CTERM system-associated)